MIKIVHLINGRSDFPAAAIVTWVEYADNATNSTAVTIATIAIADTICPGKLDPGSGHEHCRPDLRPAFGYSATVDD